MSHSTSRIYESNRRGDLRPVQIEGRLSCEPAPLCRWTAEGGRGLAAERRQRPAADGDAPVRAEDGEKNR